ncbi:hypothetical protein K9N68_31135 [Kovacikia minuta CCNUW1]|uniref:phycobilisome linker polypeptide n=1 Tax=Kovacikia minuta TaxID=2931930 RepID=UPI001CCF102C|nr:phycobilisome linker polypeptide [Kovacikia minuta]UBF25943.1 hypothetical protein K9N68_31135 [Kovacikia minuta CCNUW1]
MTATGYDDQIVWVEATGLRQSTHPSSHCIFKVPYHSLARTLQFINRSGGKIVRVSSLTLSLPNPEPFQPFIPPVGVAEPGPASDQETLPSSTPGEGTEERPPDSAEPEESVASEAKIEIGESTPESDVSETEAVPASLPIESEVSAPPPKLPGLVRLLLDKLASQANGT